MRFDAWGFEAATYGDESEPTFCIRLGEPSIILDADLNSTTALPLTLACGDEWLPFGTQIWAASDFSLVRMQECEFLDSDEGCKSTRVEWTVRGHPLPFGIGLLNRLNGTKLFWRAGDPRTEIEVQVETTSDGLVHVAGLEQGKKWERTFPWPTLREAWYQEGVAVPVRVIVQFSTGKATTRLESALLSIEPSAAISSDAFPLRRIELKRDASNALMFPGEETDFLGLGYSPREGLDWLLNESHEARSLLDRECVVGMVMERGANFTLGPPGLAPALSSTSDITIAFRDTGKKDAIWAFGHERSALTSGFTEPQKESNNSPARHVCSGGPLRSFAEAAALETRLALLHVSPWVTAEFAGVEDPPWQIYTRTPSYRFVYRPDEAATCTGVCAYHPEQVVFRADDLHLAMLSIAPGRVSEVDRL